MSIKEQAVEEQYILRVEDPALAERIRSVLRSDQDEIPANTLQIVFEAPLDSRPPPVGSDDVHGKLLFEGQEHPLTVLNLPCVTESYKTYDDINLVKTTDIGQVLVVGKQQEEQAGEVKDGITPPMRNARERLFRKPIAVNPSRVHAVEEAMLVILHGGAPSGYRFEDHEEVWQINPQTGQGEWVPAQKTKKTK